MSTSSNKDLLDSEAVLSMNQTAALLGINRATVRARIRDGSLDGVKVGRRVLIPAKSVRDLLERAK